MQLYCFLTYLSRSGSTFLTEQLNEHPQICVTLEASFPPELVGSRGYGLISFADKDAITNYLDYLFENSKLRSWGIEQEIYDSLSQFDNKYPVLGSNLFVLFLDLFRNKYKSKAQVTIYKGGPVVPWECLGVSKIFPTWKFIHIYRDPRAVYNSQKHTLHPYNNKPFARSTLEVASDWVNSIHAIEKLSKDICYEIQYEQLVQSNVSSISSIVGFFKLEMGKHDRHFNFSDLLTASE